MPPAECSNRRLRYSAPNRWSRPSSMRTARGRVPADAHPCRRGPLRRPPPSVRGRATQAASPGTAGDSMNAGSRRIRNGYLVRHLSTSRTQPIRPEPLDGPAAPSCDAISTGSRTCGSARTRDWSRTESSSARPSELRSRSTSHSGIAAEEACCLSAAVREELQDEWCRFALRPIHGLTRLDVSWREEDGSEGRGVACR